MRSQVKWGVVFLALALVVWTVFDQRILHIVYGIPLTLIGLALILFRKREDVIEKVR